MTQINQALFRLRATTSTNEKVEVLEALRHDTIAKEILNFALNPYITFGITVDTKLPPDWSIQDAKDNDDLLTLEMWTEIKSQVLMKLSSRLLTGNGALNRLEIYCYQAAISHFFCCIINKDLRAGVNVKLVNRAIPGLIPTFTIGKAADIRKGAVPKYPCLAEPKYDGTRTLAMFDSAGNVQLMSSGGLEYKNYPHIKAEINTIGYKNQVLDGEVYGDTFDDIMRVAHRGRSKKDNEGIDDKNAIYNVFDILDLDEFEASMCSYPLEARRSKLSLTLQEQDHVRLTHGIVVHNEKEVWEYHDELVVLGYEGLILKNFIGEYPFRRSSNEWIKAKKMIEFQGIVKGFYSGKGKYAGTLGGLNVEIDGVLTRVGSGFSDDERDEIWTAQNIWRSRLVKVQGQELTKAGCVRFPVFKGFV